MERKEDTARRITRRKYEEKAQGTKKRNKRELRHDDAESVM